VSDGRQDGEGSSLWDQLRRRKVVQWGIAYAAGAWGLLQGLQFLAEAFAWPSHVLRLGAVTALIGLPIVLVLAWYHGERGEQRVSRVELAIVTLLFLIGGGLFWRYQHTTPSATTAAVSAGPETGPKARSPADAGPSVAVLPFVNRSDQDKDAFFVEGIHDDILTQLSKVSALKVISRTSVQRFRDSQQSTKEIAEQLGVGSILEGGVQRAGDRVRIQVQLIDAETDANLWAESYDRELTAANIFAIQSEVAAAIAGALKATLTAGEKSRIDALPTQNLEAWEYYQLGRQRIAKLTSESVVEAEAFFQKVIDLDPHSALGYAGLADALSGQAMDAGAPWGATLDRAEASAGRALQIDPSLAEAWVAAAFVANQRGDLAHAEPMYRRALELNPSHAAALALFAWTLRGMGRVDEALARAQRGVELDPLSASANLTVAQMLGGEGRFSEAEARVRRAIEIDPSMPSAYLQLKTLQAYAQNNFVAAVRLAESLMAQFPSDPATQLELVDLYLHLGDLSRAAKLLESAEARWPNDFYSKWCAMRIPLLEGDFAAAQRLATKALDESPRDYAVLSLLVSAACRAGDCRPALDRWSKFLPEVVGPGPLRIDAANAWSATTVAALLVDAGEPDRARMTLDAAEPYMLRKTRLGYLGYGIEDVYVHALRGRRKEALLALREAEMAGWRFNWRESLLHPALDSIRDDPEFKAIVADIERDMARQRAELAKRPGDAALDVDPSR
jgi:TolB-like protein/Tfp pilus assembly protein PilF